MGIARAEFARRATALLRRKLAEAGVPLADFAVSSEEVERLLAEEPPRQTDGDAAQADGDAARVWSAWLSMRGLPAQDVDQTSGAKIRDRLAYGFGADDLVEACRLALAEPTSVGVKAVRAISRPLDSDQRVCKLLGRKYEPAARQTWLTPFDELWREAHPKAPPPEFGVMAKSVFPLVQKHGAEAVLAQCRAYLDCTEPQYVSWPKFASLFGSWHQGRRGARSYAADAVEGLE